MSIEFMSMIMFASLMILIFMFVFSELYQDNLKDKKRIIFEDFGYSIQNEFIMAAEAKQGYTRIFLVPEKLEGIEYQISSRNSTIFINYTENIFQLPIPNVLGSLKKGNNLIENKNNSIFLNS